MKFPILKGRTLPPAPPRTEEPEPFTPPPAVIDRKALAPYGRWLQTEFRTTIDPEQRELYVSEMLVYLQAMPQEERENLLTYHTFPEILTKGIRSGELTNLLRED